jgi:hypothetical protein
MKINKKAIKLIDKGLSAKTVSKLTESQINVLYSRLLGEAITQSTTTTYTIPTSDAQKGVTLPSTALQAGKKANIQQTQTGIKVTPTEEIEEDVDVDLTQDPDATADGMGMFEEKDENKPNPWAICHSQVGPKKSRKWERCVREVKKQLGEGKNPVSLFLENQIMNIVERNLPPRITKGDLVKYLSENGPATAPTKPTTKPTTKPGTKPTRPAHPGKNPNPGEKESPKAKKVSPEQAKKEVIDVIMQLLQK